MRIYRNEYKADGESGGFAFFTTHVAAAAARNKYLTDNAGANDPECTHDYADVDLTRDGLLSLLRKWEAHPDNG